MSSRTIAIGDIHGCAKALSALISAIDPGPDDTIVTLGDHIDRGPDTRGVLDTLISLKRHCQLVSLMGNHEEMFLRAGDGITRFRFWQQFGGGEMLDSYGRGRSLNLVPAVHVRFLKKCRNYFETETHLFAHANYSADQSLEDTNEQVLRWLPISQATPGPHFSGKTVIVGHEPQESGEILDLGHVKCIDTACCSGGWLTALDATSGQVWHANDMGRLRS